MLNHFFRKLGTGLVALPIVWACSSGSGTPNPHTGGSVSIQEFPGAAASAICDNVGPCCQQMGLAYDANACKALYQGLLSGYIDLVNSGKVSYSGSAAGSCLESMKTAVAACDLSSEATACETVFQGTVPAGGACQSDEECAGPADADTDCDNNVCVVEKRGVSGDVCGSTCTEDGTVTICSGTGGTGARCFTNDNLFCDSTSEVCTSRIAVGASGCGFDDDACVDAAYCDSDVCVARVAIGGSCTSSNDCVQTAYCDTTTGVCAAQKPTGASCTSSFECSDGECDAGQCRKGGSGFSFICSGSAP